MTFYSPRIYIYKITFLEVPYYYYGVHKEKLFGEEYWGTPVTHKWCWEFYTPKKQILELFPCTDEGWLEANEIEKRIIKQFYNNDKWCLNENVGGIFSLSSCIRAGKIGGNINAINKTGVCKLTYEERKEIGKRSGSNGGNKSYEMRVIICQQGKYQPLSSTVLSRTSFDCEYIIRPRRVLMGGWVDTSETAPEVPVCLCGPSKIQESTKGTPMSTKTLYKVIGFGHANHGFFNQFACSSSIGYACGIYDAHLHDPEMDGAVIIRCNHEDWEVIQEFCSESYPYSVECGPLFTHKVTKSPDLVMV